MQVSSIGANVALAAVLGKGDDGKGGGKVDSVVQQATVQAAAVLSDGKVDGKVDGKGGLLDIIA